MGGGVRPYEGTGAYIFVSYSHKDSDLVLPVINRLQNDGFRVWYDDGIVPGTEWPETIAQHLNDCAVFVPFLSNTYVDSFNCKRELDFAVQKRKAFLAVFLEETQMPLGMEMQISTVQAMKYYTVSEEVFFERLYESGMFDSCRVTQPANARITDVSESGGKADYGVNVVSGMNAGVIKPDEKNVPGKADSGNHASDNSASARKIAFPLPLIICPAVLLLLIAGLGIFLIFGTPNPYLNQDEVFLSDQTVTDKDLKQIAADKMLDSLILENCELPTDHPEIWNKITAKLRILDVSGCNLTDEDLLTIVSEAPDLYPIDISDNPKIKNLNFLKQCNAGGEPFILDISHTQITDLTPLSKVNLEELRAEGNHITDLSGLGKCEDVRALYLADNEITEVTGDYNFESLESIDLSGNGIEKLSFLTTAIHLKYIKMDDNKIQSLKVLENCTILEDVSFCRNRIMGVSALSASAGSLTRLNLADNQISRIEFLLPEADWINLDHNSISYLGFLAESSGLTYFSAEGNRLDDISELAYCPSLMDAYLSKNRISDEVDLRELKLLHNCILDHNRITKIYVSDVDVLAVTDNPIEEIITEETGTVFEVYMTYRTNGPDLTADPFCTYLTLFDCPYNLRVSIEEVWGSGIRFEDKEETETLLEELKSGKDEP